MLATLHGVAPRPAVGLQALLALGRRALPLPPAELPIWLTQAKPWGEIMDRNAFGKPASMAEVCGMMQQAQVEVCPCLTVPRGTLPAQCIQAMGRIRKNVAYFRTNYAILAVGTTALVMFMKWVGIDTMAQLAHHRGLPLPSSLLSTCAAPSP